MSSSSSNRATAAAVGPWHWNQSPFGVPFHPHLPHSGSDLNSQRGGGEAGGGSMEIDIPDRETMQERWKFRDDMLRETADHRRIHPQHAGLGHTGRNIMHVLYDRERQGARAVQPLRRERKASRFFGDTIGISGSTHNCKSPATVCESPISTTQVDEAAASSASDPEEEKNKRAAAAAAAAAETEKQTAAAHDPTNNTSASETDTTTDQKSLLRRVVYPTQIANEVRFFAEYASTTRYHSAFLHHLGGDDERDEQGNRPESSKAVSTISVAFSPDSQTMASTHGDHTVKISCCSTGGLLQSLDGHPRTPWTVKYHPTDSEVIASGCLGHQVRLWNWVEKTCLQMVRLDYAIISVSFHPSGKLLAVANGTRLHFWGIDPKRERTTSSSDRGGANTNNESGADTAAADTATSPTNRANQLSNILSEIDQRHMLRCVHFPPNGKGIIIGGVNPTNEDPRRRQRGGIGGGGMSFYLRLWDFDLDTALKPQVDLPVGLPPSIRRAISNPRTFVPRALLYNDGGFDVSPDGKTVCACAEIWLPDGVDNAMDLLVKEETAAPDTADEPDEEPATAPDDAAVGPAAARSIAETHSAVSAALKRLKGVTQETNRGSHGRSPSFREGMDTLVQLQSKLQQQQQQSGSATPAQPRTPSDTTPALDFVPRTPPIPREQNMRLSPPSPPGRRFVGMRSSNAREAVSTSGSEQLPDSNSNNPRQNLSTPAPPPPPPPPPAPGGLTTRLPHPLSVPSSNTSSQWELIQRPGGRYVPHVVTVSLDTSPLQPELEHLWPRGKHPGAIAKGYRPRLGQLLEACPLDPSKASAVTCVKFSPSTGFCLIGYGVREPEGGGKFHPVTALYRIRGGMEHVSTMLSEIDDVNIARFHPDSGHGFVYGTKQGRVRILSPRPWNFYN